MILTKTFSTEDHDFGYNNSIDIRVDYDPQYRDVELERVFAFNSKDSCITDITELFEKMPFCKIVSEIDWNEVYAEEMAEKEEYYEEN